MTTTCVQAIQASISVEFIASRLKDEQEPRLALVQPDLQRRDVSPHRLNVRLHLAQPGVDALRDPLERGDGLGGDVALLLHQCPHRRAQLRGVRGQLFQAVEGFVQRLQPRSTIGHDRQRLSMAQSVAHRSQRIPDGTEDLLHLRDAWPEIRLQALVQRVEHGPVRLRLCADGIDGLGGLAHFRPALRDEVVHPPHAGIDHPGTGFDHAKPFQRDIGGLAIDLPRAEDAAQAQANDQDRKGDGSNTSCLLEDSHTGAPPTRRSG